MFRYRGSARAGWCSALLILALVLGLAWTPSATAQTADLADSQDGKKFKTYLPLANAAAPAPQETWLDRVNAYRRMAQLAPLAENTAWSDGCAKHARYIVKNDILDHTEAHDNPWYTLEGATAARSSNLIAASGYTLSDLWAIDSWMTTPFHALGLLDVRLQTTGFGSYREAGSGYRMAAVIDVIRGRDQTPSSRLFPIMWPGPGATVTLRRFAWSEYPDPLAACPGYKLPTGLPIIVQMGDGNRTPRVTAHSFAASSMPDIVLESCVFTESTYANPDTSMQALGRALLNPRDAIVLIPRAVLNSGASYTVSLTVDGQTYTWSFSVAAIQ